MTDHIRVTPVTAQRTAFARWAVAQTPKLRTVAHDTFAVPADLYSAMPEALLIGALVDGHRYVSPDEDQAVEVTGVASGGILSPSAVFADPEGAGLPVADDDGFRDATPGGLLPPVDDSAHPEDSVPLPVDYAPLDDAPGGTGEEEDDGQGGVPGDSDPSDPDAGMTAPPRQEPGSVTEEFTINPCPLCPREFTTARGRDTHVRMAHHEES